MKQNSIYMLKNEKIFIPQVLLELELELELERLVRFEFEQLVHLELKLQQQVHLDFERLVRLEQELEYTICTSKE